MQWTPLLTPARTVPSERWCRACQAMQPCEAQLVGHATHEGVTARVFEMGPCRVCEQRQKAKG